MLKQCTFQLQFCDAQRKIKECFRCDESIYTLLSITNIFDEPVYVGIAPGHAFGRFGLKILLQDAEPGRVETTIRLRMKLLPRETYTFFRTFTFSESTKDSHVAYGTPPPGKYCAKVVYGTGETILGTSSFSVVAKDSDSNKEKKNADSR